MVLFTLIIFGVEVQNAADYMGLVCVAKGFEECMQLVDSVSLKKIKKSCNLVSFYLQVLKMIEKNPFKVNFNE